MKWSHSCAGSCREGAATSLVERDLSRCRVNYGVNHGNQHAHILFNAFALVCISSDLRIIRFTSQVVYIGVEPLGSL